MAEAAEREPQVEPAVPTSAGPAAAISGGVSDLAGAGHSRPPMSRGTVMRLQGSAGNAAVSGLMDGTHRSDSAVRTVTLPTPGDAELMRAIVARAPATLTEDRPIVAPDKDQPAERSPDSESEAAGPSDAAQGTVAGGESAAAGSPGAAAAASGLAGAALRGGADAAAQGALAGGESAVADAAGAAQGASTGGAAGASGPLGAALRGGAPTAGVVAQGALAGGDAATTGLSGAAEGALAGLAGAALPDGSPAAQGALAGGESPTTEVSGAASSAQDALEPGAAAQGGAAAQAALAGGGSAAAGGLPGTAPQAGQVPGGAAVPGVAGAVPSAGEAAGAAAGGPGAIEALAGAAGGEAAAPGAAVAAAGGGAAGPVSVLGNAGAIAGAMGGIASAVTGGLAAATPGAAPSASGPVSAPDAGGAAGGGESEGAAAEGPSEDELTAIDEQLAAGPQEEEEAPEAAAVESVAAPAAEPAATPAVQDTPEAVVEGPEPAPAAIVESAGPSSMEDVVAAEASVASVPETEMVAEPSAEEQSATAAVEAEDAGAETLSEGGGEAVLARAATTEVLAPPTEDLTAEPDEEPAVDPAAISADAQGEMEALGASGGGEFTGGGGGGGGGGGAVEAEPEQPAPDVSNADPAQAVSQAASLKPAQMLETLGGAEKAAANHVTKEHEKLAAQPPELEAGGGPDGPAADEKHVSTPPSRPTTTKPAEKTGGAPEKPAPTPSPPAKAPLPAGPTLKPDEKGNVSDGDGAKIKAAIEALPTTDGAVTVPQIAVPKLSLTGAADPGQMAEQKQHLDQTVGKATAQGAQEANEPAGENDLAPTVKAEKIKAEIPAGAAQAAPGAAGPGADDDVASIVAEQEQGPALKAAASQAASQIDAEKQQHAAKSAQTKAAALEEAQAEEAKGKADQIAEHAAAKAGVSQARQDWTADQKQQADAAKLEATGAVGEAQTAIQSEKTRAEADAIKHVEAGRKEAEDHKRKGDEEAKAEKDKAKQEEGGGGFFGWVASKAKALYDKVKDGITAVFNKVRSAITTAINKAKELAHSVIDRAVKFVADKVKAVAGKLLAIGDKLIPGFAAARQKFGKWIKDRVKQAVTALNKIVTAVKDGIKKVMTAVGNALKQGLDLLKKGISAAIDAVKNVVKAAIEKAKAAIAALGQFATIIKDIASNPGQWLSNLGASVVDGIKNHLWVALKTAVQGWFNEKLESLLGLGKSVMSLLAKGGISMAQVGKMAFEALKAAIPPALIALLVERLVSMIVPAAGAVMAVVQGLMAAWGAIQKILAAIDRFIAFLKAVKSGNAGPAFANALAAAAVAVIEFVSQFLLRKIAGAAAKVAGKIKAIAQKIGKKLMTAMKKVGKKLKGGLKKIKRGVTKAKDKVFGKKQKKTDEEKKQDKQDRLDKAAAALRPKIAALMAKGTTGLFLKGRLLAWRLMYRLSKLEAKKGGSSVQIVATVNPFAEIGQGTELNGERLRQLAHKVAERLLQRDDVIAAAERIRKNWEERPGTDTDIEAGVGYMGGTKAHQQRPAQPWGHKEYYRSGDDRHRIGEQQKTGATNQFIDKIGSYPEMADAIKASGMSDTRFALMIRSYAATGKLPEGLSQQHGDMVAQMAYLMFVRESHRNQGNVSMGPMTLDLIRSGNMTFDEAFKAFEPTEEGGKPTKPMGRGAYPMSGVGAPAAERGLAFEEDRPMIGTSKGKVENRRELQRREVELVSRWVATQFKAEGGAIAASETAIAEKIEQMVLGFYKMK